MAQFHLNSKKYTLADNFLTSNCYSCMELNAQSLILCIAYLKHNDMPELFLPHLYESQPCESIFRQFRSFTPTYSTVANCTVKEAESRISKIQLQNDIINEISPFFVYPRLAKLETQTNNETTVTAELPTNRKSKKKEVDLHHLLFSLSFQILVSDVHISSFHFICFNKSKLNK